MDDGMDGDRHRQMRCWWLTSILQNTYEAPPPCATVPKQVCRQVGGHMIVKHSQHFVPFDKKANSRIENKAHLEKSKDQKSFAVGQFSFWEVVYDALTITILAINIIIVVILIITIVRLPSSTRKRSAQTFLKNPASPVQGSAANLDDDDKTMTRIIMIVIVTSPIFYIFDII